MVVIGTRGHHDNSTNVEIYFLWGLCMHLSTMNVFLTKCFRAKPSYNYCKTVSQTSGRVFITISCNNYGSTGLVLGANYQHFFVLFFISLQYSRTLTLTELKIWMDVLLLFVYEPQRWLIVLLLY